LSHAHFPCTTAQLQSYSPHTITLLHSQLLPFPAPLAYLLAFCPPYGLGFGNSAVANVGNVLVPLVGGGSGIPAVLLIAEPFVGGGPPIEIERIRDGGGPVGGANADPPERDEEGAWDGGGGGAPREGGGLGAGGGGELIT